MDISVETQASWNNPKKALEIWRDRIEDKGIFVFKNAFRDDSVDGFSLVHEQFPVIYLNNSRPHVRQIFSLFHELGHLLLGENGITRGVKIGGEKIERFCNEFAAEFLVPFSDLETLLNFPNYEDSVIEKAVSERKSIKWMEVHESNLEKTAESKKSGGRDYNNTRAVYLGYRFLELAFSKYHQGGCSIEELAEHLNVKVKDLPGLEDRLLKRGSS